MFVGRDDNVTLSRERERDLSVTMREKGRNTTKRYVLYYIEREIITI